MESGEIIYEIVCVSPLLPPKISFKVNWMKELDSKVAGSSEDSQQIQPKSKTQSSRTVRPVCEQPSGLLTKEIEKDVLFGFESTNSRTVRPVNASSFSQSCVPVSVERVDKDKDADENVDADQTRTVRLVSGQPTGLFTQLEEIDKITRAPCRRRNGGAAPRAENFGDLITADHKVLSDNCESRNNHRYAVVVQDWPLNGSKRTRAKQKLPRKHKRSLQKFLEPDRKPKVIETDNSLEFGKACEDLSWNHCTSTPHRSETNGIAERAVRRVKEGTSAVLLQSGLDENWSADSMECCIYLPNVTDLLSDGKTPYESRFGEPFKGPIIPFGSLVEYHPITAKDQSRIHQFGKKVSPGLLLGYALYAVGFWKGDIMVAHIEELETMDASEIYSKKLNAKEVTFPKENGKFVFRVADGRIKFAGGDQELRTPTLIRNHPIRGESHLDFLGESEGSLPPPQDSLPDAGEAMKTSGPRQKTSFSAITLNPESNFTRRERNHSLFH